MSGTSEERGDAERAGFVGKETCGRVVNMLSLFSNETRLHILCTLYEDDFCVSEIVEYVGGRHSNVSQQLKILTVAGYLTKERRGRTVVYHLQSQSIRKLIGFLRAEFG